MDGLVTMTPSSASGLISTSPDVDAGDDVTQSSFVKVNANGGVDFQNVVSVSLNGVFTGEFDNYLVSISGVSTSDRTIYCRLRASNADAQINYATQTLESRAAVVTGRRDVSQVWGEVGTFRGGGLLGASEVYFYGPSLDKPTAWRAVTIEEGSKASILDRACTHSTGVAYDGFTILSGSAVTFTGNLIVMGYAE